MVFWGSAGKKLMEANKETFSHPVFAQTSVFFPCLSFRCFLKRSVQYDGAKSTRKFLSCLLGKYRCSRAVTQREILKEGGSTNYKSHQRSLAYFSHFAALFFFTER